MYKSWTAEKAAAFQGRLCCMKLVNFIYIVIWTKRKKETRSQTVIHQCVNEEMDFVTAGCYFSCLKSNTGISRYKFPLSFQKRVSCWVDSGITCLVYERTISVPQSDAASCQLFKTFFGNCHTRSDRKGNFVLFLGLFGETLGSYLDTRESQIMAVRTRL